MSIQVEARKKLKNFVLNIDFQAEGSLAILGPSGCGKSMTLKCIAGIVTPEEGRISVNENVLFDSHEKINIRPQKRRVGYLFQDYALFPTMNVMQNIACGLSGAKKEKEIKVEELISRFHLNGLENHYPHQLSGGQQQRTALARVMAYEPQVLLLDEPFSALDIYLREKIQMETLDLLKDFTGDMIMVTHDPAEACRICDSFLVLDHGRCIAKGNAREFSVMDDRSSLSQESELLLSYLKETMSKIIDEGVS